MSVEFLVQAGAQRTYGIARSNLHYFGDLVRQVSVGG
jgi:hypothetical protein